MNRDNGGRFSLRRAATGLGVVLIGACGAYVVQPLAHGNDDVINIIATIFSILAGFLVAIITLVGDPSSLPKGSWRIAQLASKRTKRRLVRNYWLFMCYLVALVLTLATLLIGKLGGTVLLVFEYLYLFFAIVGFLFSFFLPAHLMKMQKERIEYEIQARRAEAGIKDRDQVTPSQADE